MLTIELELKLQLHYLKVLSYTFLSLFSITLLTKNVFFFLSFQLSTFNNIINIMGIYIIKYFKHWIVYKLRRL